MKKQKSMDSLLSSLENQKEAVVLNEEGKSIQYWCGVGAYAGDEFGGHPPQVLPNP
ncbi:hypothetical protein [Aquimarina algiphila]|uniref:hypothetical protein n=1 Tax=Aquimarina algiphila TaxID=2047982 RepID=UPI001432090C|nr:hypothetical protein [Aquimarina algiphila]